MHVCFLSFFLPASWCGSRLRPRPGLQLFRIQGRKMDHSSFEWPFFLSNGQLLVLGLWFSNPRRKMTWSERKMWHLHAVRLRSGGCASALGRMVFCLSYKTLNTAMEEPFRSRNCHGWLLFSCFRPWSDLICWGPPEKVMYNHFLFFFSEKKGQQVFFVVVERPGHLLMRVAVGIHGNDIDGAIEVIFCLFFSHWMQRLSKDFVFRPTIACLYDGSRTRPRPCSMPVHRSRSFRGTFRGPGVRFELLSRYFRCKFCDFQI